MGEFSPFLFFTVLAVAFITAELLIFNLSVFWFLFVGIGALIAALFAWLVPGFGWVFSTLVFVVASAITSLALYKPLRRWQKKPGAMPGNDALGQSVEVLEEIADNQRGQVLWSGAKWDAKLVEGSEPLNKGDYAKIDQVRGIVLLVKKD